jgi:hypothetical protein
VHVAIAAACLSLVAIGCANAPAAKDVDGVEPAAEEMGVLEPVAAAPRLVLQITVDQLRGDMPNSAMPHLPPGGLRYLYERGAVYSNARHRHSNTETIVGHTTLSTGADPAQHGMVGNVWFDRATGATRYNIEDADYHLVGEGGDVDAKTEIDPTQRAARSDGRSPRAILTSTFSDEVARAGGGKAKVFGVSVKDRGAVAMAGHSGKAFWFSKQKGEFVTSTYYYDAYPDWVTEWNGRGLPASYANRTWSLWRDRKTYEHADADDMPWETDLAGFGRTFPHAFGPADSRYFTTFLTVSPAGDELTVSFANALLEAEHLGQDDVTDYLSVSLSSTDYIGHLFGPKSLESEDNLRRLDHSITQLLAAVDVHVGLDNTLIVLSADHGAPDVPEQLEALGQDAGYVDADFVTSDAVDRALRAKYGIGTDVVLSYEHPHVYLDHTKLPSGPKRVEFIRSLRDLLAQAEGIHRVVAWDAVRDERFAADAVFDAVERNRHPERSGDLYVVTKPNWFINHFDGLEVAASHGSPWHYDQWVPIVFAGHETLPQCISREVETVSIAPTLSAYLGIAKPSGASAPPLKEALDRR